MGCEAKRKILTASKAKKSPPNIIRLNLMCIAVGGDLNQLALARKQFSYRAKRATLQLRSSLRKVEIVIGLRVFFEVFDKHTR